MKKKPRSRKNDFLIGDYLTADIQESTKKFSERLAVEFEDIWDEIRRVEKTVYTLRQEIIEGLNRKK